MKGLPPALGGPSGLFMWRLDEPRHSTSWDSGEGAALHGGRWNSKGHKAVYCALDSATAILEVAVNKSFRALDAVPHVLTCSRILVDASKVHVVAPEDVPEQEWLHPGIPSAKQRQYGDSLLSQHPLVVLPSVVSMHSWNVVLDPDQASSDYELVEQEPFSLDPRLHSAG